MGCRDIRETISAFVDGEASPEEAGVVREHLASCGRCRVLERRMRAVGDGVRQIEGTVPDRFREAVFARLDAEGALPPPMLVHARSWRWAAVPLAAAAALGWFLLTSRVPIREGAVPGPSAVLLTNEDREMIALLDILEDTVSLDADGDAEGMELLAPGDSAEPSRPTRGGRSGA